MGTYSLFFLIVPLLIFVLVDTFASLNIALICTVLVAGGECLFSYFYLGSLDSFSIFSIFLVFLLAGLTFTKKSREIFYLKPAILSLGLGIFLIVTYCMWQYVLYDGMLKYGDLLSTDSSVILDNIKFQAMFKNASLSVGLAMILHGLLSTYAALKLNRWWWFVLAGLGSYVFLFVGMTVAFLI